MESPLGTAVAGRIARLLCGPRRRAGAIFATALGPFVLLVGLALGAPGQLDPTFGTGGIVTYPSGAGPTSSAAALLSHADGTVSYAGATDTPGGATEFLVARLRSDGTPDPSFNGG